MSTIHVQPGSEAMKALAHPLRVKLLALLRADGPSTASRLADRLGLASGLTSYHLRLLADAALIVEQPDRGTARDRWWAAAHESTTWRFEDFGDPAAWDTAMGETAVLWEVFRRRAIEAFESGRSAWSDEWQAAADRSDSILRLTPAELREMTSRVAAVLDPYTELSLARRDGRETAPDNAASVVFFRTAVPVSNIADVIGTNDANTTDT